MPVPMRGGKMYATVQERLKAAHGDALPVGIKSIVTEPISVPTLHGATLLIKATVTFEDGSHYTGLSEVPFDATSGAEKTNPVEVAETSAAGRALAFAGYYGSETGLAGAEEMREAQRRESLPPRGQDNAPRRTQMAAPIDEDRFAGLDVPAEFEQDTRRMSTATRADNYERNAPAGGDFVSAPQIKLISILLKKLHLDMPADINTYSKRQASDYITQLKQDAGED